MPQTHPSVAIFREFPNVSKKKLTEEDALAVRRALVNVQARITEIGRSLGVSGDRITRIKQLHSSGDGRGVIAVIDTWLRGVFDASREPYTIPGNEPHQSWWNLVWAVSHKVGGKDPSEARIIANNYESFHHSDPEPHYANVDATPLEKDDAVSVVCDLEDVWRFWYEIGIGLKMPASTLDQFTDTSEKNMTDMIATWITEGAGKGPPLPNWSQLVEVVAASYGGQSPSLAEQLAKKYSTGEGESESEQMETEVSSTTPPADQAAVPGGVGEDSALSHPALSDPQPEVPLASIADDGGKLTLDHFVVYPRNKYSGGNSKPHGLALVITNGKFQGLPQRLCAKVDEERLESCLSDVGYRVVIRRDQTAEEMVRLIESVGKGTGKDRELRLKKDDDSFVCVISSHGDWDRGKNTDVIYGRDADTMDLKETAYKFLGTTACELLKGKPKLFFVQACRGEEYGKIAADDSGPSRLPHESDFFISYSTAPMTKAFRYDPGKSQPEGKQVDLTTEESYDKYNIGSFYITEMCLAFKNLAQKMDLMSMVLFVHQRLQASDKMLFKVGSKTTRQCPHMSVSLRGPVFFFDKAEIIFKEHVKQCLPK